jgi:O-succinylbenzoic acid--CoA ligase
VTDLVGLALPGGPAFVDELRRAWDAGDAVAPIDLRLPPAARDEALAAIRPTVIVDEHGRRRVDGGQQALAGDALVMTTSGTSGTPKGVVLTHAGVAAAARATSAALDVDPATDRWLACLPLAHVGGLSVVTRAMLSDTAVEVHTGFDAAAVADAARRGATLVSLVPAVLSRLDPSVFRRIGDPGRPSAQQRGHLRDDRDRRGARLRRPAARQRGDPGGRR